MARKHIVPFLSGRLETWGAAVVYAVGQINFLFDKSFEPYIAPDDICNHFGGKQSTISNKAREIRDMFKMRNWDKDFSTEAMNERNPFKDMVVFNGLIVPKRLLPPEIRQMIDGD